MMITSLKVKDYMSVNTTTFTPDMDILHAIKVMLEAKISGAPVIDNRSNLIGFLSEKDCMQVALNAAYQQAGVAGRVEEFMTKQIDIIDIETPIIDVAERFLKGSFKRYPVIKDNRLVGTITRQHILVALAAITSAECTGDSKNLAKQSVHS